MKLEVGIHAHLKNNPGVAALVGTRIYPIKMPQDSPLPAVVYQRVSKVRGHAFDGESGDVESRYHISTFAATLAQAMQVSSAVRSSLKPFFKAPGTLNGVHIGGVFLENEFPIFEPEEVQTLSQYHVLGDYVFLHAEDD